MKPVIYILSHCPYCHKVSDFASEHNIEIEYKDTGDAAIKQELIDRSGKTQVPYLVDTANNIEMPESDDIIEYLKKNYAK